MKQIFAFLFLLLIPNFVLALPDSCGNPKDFTIDKRCYVTGTKKNEKPYNAIVSLVKSDRGYCTGTIVKINDKLYLYTAKHCSDKNRDNRPDDFLTITMQNGRSLSVRYNNSGDYDIEHDKIFDGDWAVYTINEQILPYVSISDKSSTKYKIGSNDIVYDARLIGYGGLKVMSDEEIREFKNKYIDYLRNIEGITGDIYQNKYGFSYGGIYVNEDETGNPYVLDFLDYLNREERYYYLDVFEDVAFLKESKCGYYSSGVQKECQSWGGNSGGGIFDDRGNLMAISTRGRRIIGGAYHANKEKKSYDIEQINLLQESGEKSETGLIDGLMDLFK